MHNSSIIGSICTFKYPSTRIPLMDLSIQGWQICIVHLFLNACIGTTSKNLCVRRVLKVFG